ncbi:hypothetical protein [uncultured Ilyobacter sp.]|uniref:hypothetical protein n=1 Tax=uncultured Ilyobacter sp. TaxID=544433 RepID=UPI0029BFC57B|nr:hypothetical protein [uncultured Ilyobacter sp.]
MKKRIALLLAGLAIVSGTALGASFKLTDEIKINDETNYRSDERIKTEWTIAKGEYKADNGLKLKFDIDRDDINYDASGYEDHEGWDTYFAAYYPLASVELGGLTFKNEIGAEVYYDQEDSYDKNGSEQSEKEETELGLAFKTKTQLNDFTTLSAKLWGRNVDYEKGTTDEDEVLYGIETSLEMDFNKNWSAEVEVDGFWGGYSDSANTFAGDGIDSFNYEVFAYLNYVQDLYKTDNFKLFFATEFAAEYYAQGDDYKDAEEDYVSHYVMPGVGFKYGVAESVDLYGWTGYKVLGEVANGDGTVDDNNEWESVVGFKVAM